MSQAFVGEVRMFAINFAPTNWADCDGQLLPLAQNTTLFSVIGSTFGGDGKTNFGLPDLRGAAVLGVGTAATGTEYVLGEIAGSAYVTLLDAEIPSHTHSFQTASVRFPGNTNVPGPTVMLAPATGCTPYVPATPPPTPTAMSPDALSPSGQGVPHNNTAPFLAIRYCICMTGTMPTRPVSTSASGHRP